MICVRPHASPTQFCAAPIRHDHPQLDWVSSAMPSALRLGL